MVRKILHSRRKRGGGPARIGDKLRLRHSTVNRVLRREGEPLLHELDLATRKELRAKVERYERDAPGDLVHVDIKKLGLIPDGEGHRVHGRALGRRNSRLSRALRQLKATSRARQDRGKVVRSRGAASGRRTR